MRYLANRSRCLDGMNDTQVEEVVLRILETREAVNKKGGGGQKIPEDVACSEECAEDKEDQPFVLLDATFKIP